MDKWQAIVFDLDDTLYPEREYVLSGFRVVAQQAQEQWGINAEQGFAELEQLFRQGVRGNTFNRWLAKYGLEQPETVNHLIQVYRSHIPRINVFPEVPALLARLRQRYRLGIVSDGWLAVQQRKLDALRLSDYFDAIVLSDEWGREFWKPNIKPFEVVIQRLNVAANQVVYVADNPIKDFLGARHIGLATVHLRQPGGEYAQRDAPSPEYAGDICIEALSDLESALDQLCSG